MENTKRLNQVTFSMSIFGFTSALFLFSLIFGLGAGWQTINKDNRFYPIGWNPFQDMAVTYFIISVCLLVFIALSWKRNNVVLKAVGFIPLAVILLQCRILIIFKPGKLPDWVTGYSSWLELIWYMDFFFLALAGLLTILHIYSIWLVYRSPLPVNP